METSLILASASPRRRDLLAGLGFTFEVVPSAVPESPRPGEAPEAFALRLAREKASQVARRRPGHFVLGADTVVIVGDTVLGKPQDRNDGRRMLQLLSGRTHRVVTGVALVDPTARIVELLVESEVEFRDLQADEIERYLDTGEGFDKAGGYAVQGRAKVFVLRVRGSYSNVVGLPQEEVCDLLRRRLRAEVATAP
jgi:septum formation protein